MAESNNVMLMVALSWITLTTAHQMTINEANPPCEAPLVWEGQTGKLKFFYRPEAFSSEAFFAILKRADNPGKDIIVCTTRLGIKCNVSSPQYNLHSVTNHSLTVLIPRITKDFEDTYLLLTYTKGTLPPTDACRLVVKANKETCDNPAVLEGQIGKLTFFLRPDILAFEDFFATLRRATDPGRDILVCTRKSPLNCHISSPHVYQSNGIVDGTLTLLIPNVSRTFEDTYVLKVYANGSSPPFDACSLHVKVAGDEDGSNDWIAAPIICLLLLLIIGILLLFYRKKIMPCWRRASKAYQSDDSDASSMLLTDENDAQRCDVTTKRWYFGRMSPEDEAELSHFKRRNKPSSFLVREDGRYLILAVCGDDSDNKHFRIDTDDGYKIEGTDETFDTLPLLIEYYRKNDIIHRGQTAGRLGNPFEVEPKEVWYAGKMRRRLEKKLFSSTGNQPNSFLLRDSITSPGDYTLAVYISKMRKRKHFLICLDENSFNFCDANTKFKSLAELVHYYQANDIETTKEGNFGKLGTPIGAQTTGCHCM